MGHEDAVYLAKLAEQAERYEGKFDIFCLASLSSCMKEIKGDGKRKQKRKEERGKKKFRGMDDLLIAFCRRDG